MQALETAMQQISLLLLLVIGLGGSHEDQHSNQQLLQIVTTESIGEDGGSNNAQEVDVELSKNAVLNALMAFGINDTDIRPGQILCPPSHLNSSYKGNRIVVGAVGCKLDPLIAHYTEEQKRALKGHHDDDYISPNCTDSIMNLAGYFPPIPGMIKINVKHTSNYLN